jgi:hypothetical protein
MAHVHRFSSLSPERQALVRILQAMNFGEIREVHVRDGEPMFDHASVMLLDAKLDSEEAPRSELNLPDFELRAEIVRLMSRLHELNNGTIRRLEVRAGVPRRLVFETRFSAEFGPSNPAKDQLE